MTLRSNQSNRVGAVVSLAALAFAVVPVSHAGSFVFTFGYTGIGQFAYTPSGGVLDNLGAATSVTFPHTMLVNNVPQYWDGTAGLNWCYGKLVEDATPITVSPLTLPTTSGSVSLGHPYLDFWTTGVDTGGIPQDLQFTLTQITFTSSGNDNLSFTGLGTLHDATDSAILSDRASNISGSLSQANANSAINGSFTLAGVPEPTDYGFLAGLGLLGFGLWRRIPVRSNLKHAARPAINRVGRRGATDSRRRSVETWDAQTYGASFNQSK